VGPPPAESAAPPKKRRRRVGWIITVTLLGLMLIGVGVVLALTLIRLNEALEVIDEQKDLIDRKDTFSTSMQKLVDQTTGFEGVTVGDVVPEDQIRLLAARGYRNRWDADAMTSVTAEVDDLTQQLAGTLAAADEQKATNSSKSAYEAVIDKLGGGFALTKIDNADKLCKQDVLGCVTSDDPYTVHIDKADTTQPFMTTFIQKGIAYHEFAHVLQYTHPAESDTAAEAFKGDYEKMADCFALTYLKGWKLHHTVYVTTYSYYEVDIGYGYTCNAKQKQVIRDWYEGLGYTASDVSQ